MFDPARSEVEVEVEVESDGERYEEAVEQVPEGAAGQAVEDTAVPAIPDWAAELLAQLAEGETFSARDQTRLHGRIERARVGLLVIKILLIVACKR